MTRQQLPKTAGRSKEQGDRRFPSLLNCLGQSATEYLLVVACLISVGLATPHLINEMGDTISNKYKSYAFGVAISDPPTVAYDKKVQELIDLIEKWGKKVLDFLEKFIRGIVDFFLHGIPDIFKWIKQQLDDLWALLQDPAKLLQKVKDVIQQILDALWDAIKDFGKMVWDVIKDIAKAVWDFFKKAAETIWHIITHPWEAIEGIIKGLLGMTKEVLKFFCGGD
jgi:phage-related protein